MKLDFLGPGSWTLRLWKDAPDNDTAGEHLIAEQRVVTATPAVMKARAFLQNIFRGVRGLLRPPPSITLLLGLRGSLVSSDGKTRTLNSGT